MTQAIDFDSHIPYYVQFANLIKRQIQTGELNLGDQLPGEQELCQNFGISRTVVRQALDVLGREHLIYRRKGKGTFVTQPIINTSYAQKLSGFYHEMKMRGLEPTTRIIKNQVIRAPKRIAAQLDLSPGDLVVEIERLRFLFDIPILLVTNYIPHEFCPHLVKADLTNQSLYDFLEEQMGMVIAFGKRSIEAVRAKADQAELLEISPGSPVLKLESVSFLEDQTPIEYYFSYHRADRSRFEVEMFRIEE